MENFIIRACNYICKYMAVYRQCSAIQFLHIKTVVRVDGVDGKKEKLYVSRRRICNYSCSVNRQTERKKKGLEEKQRVMGRTIMMMMMDGWINDLRNSRDDIIKFTLLHADLDDFNFIVRYGRVGRRD